MQCAGSILGSPTRFGNMAAPAEVLPGRHQRAVAFRRARRANPAGVFTSTQTLHGGQESTLLSMMIPLLHHGMYLVGLPFTERGLHRHPQRRHALRRKPCGWPRAGMANCPKRARTGARLGRAGGRARRAPAEPAVSLDNSTRSLAIWLWVAVVLSLLAWMAAGYPVADLRARRAAAAGAAARPGARPPPHLRVGDLVRHSLSGVCADRAAGQPRRAVGRPRSACCWYSPGSAL